MPSAPSPRVSELISRFQERSMPSPSDSQSPTVLRPSARGDLPLHPPPAAPPSRTAAVRSGSVGEHVGRFSVDPARPPNERESSDEGRGHGRVQKGRLGDMDWTERAAPKPASARPSAPPTPPSPTTKPTLSSPSHLSSPPTRPSLIGFKPRRPAPSPPSADSKPAPTVLVPATVSSDAQDGKTRIGIELRKAEEVTEGQNCAHNEQRKPIEPSSSPSDTRRPLPPPQTQAPSSSTRVKRKPPPSFVELLSAAPTLPTPTSRATVAEHPLHSDPPSSNLSLALVSPSVPAAELALPFNELASTHPLLGASSPPADFHHRSDLSSKSASSTLPLLARPPLPHSCTSLTCSSGGATQHLPAAQLFASNAEPLVLPFVDQAIKDLGGPVRFSAIDDSALIWGEGEKKGWHEWVRGSDEGKKSWLAGIKGALKLRGSNKSYVDLEADDERKEHDDRALIFPPMHLVPPKMTVTDLKRNQRAPMAAIGLQSVLTAALNGALSAAGSTFGIDLTTVEMFRDLVQMIFLLTLVSSTGASSSSWYRTLFVVIPSALSLDFVSAFGRAIVWLWIFTLVAALAVYEVWRFSGGWSGVPSERRDLGEGFDAEGARQGEGARRWTRWRDSYVWKVTVTFVATSLYLPLSKLSIGALVWTSDYWAVNNPYLASDSPIHLPLGPSDSFYDSLDFCYRTTMRRPTGFLHLGHFNWAYIILPVAGLAVGWITIALPWRLHRLAKQQAPRPDLFTELGEKRANIDAEYQRLIDADRSPFSYLYREYRRPRAAFKSYYMLIKLLNVLIVVILQRENCLFRSQTSVYLGVVRQGSLVAFMSLFLLHMAFSKPFLDSISNRSDRVSRIGYVAIAVVGLLVALDVKGKEQLGGPILILINVIVYAFNGYFAAIGTDFAQRIVKRLQHRLDTSIDIFSPQLDLGKHLSRRIWHETISTILLAGPEYAMPVDAKLDFSDDPDLPPYLLNFCGSVAERHVENLKILREIGLDAYDAGLRSQERDVDSELQRFRFIIHGQLAGPDVWYRPPQAITRPSVTTFFGRLFVVPFPFTAVVRYDQDPLHPLHLTGRAELAALVQQNQSVEVQSRRKVRLALRALEGHAIFAPHVEVKKIGRRGGIEVQRTVHYRLGKLSIGRKSAVEWNGYNYSSGFNITLSYTDGQGSDGSGRFSKDQRLTLDAAQLGISDNFALTSSLAILFRRNKDLLEARLPPIEETLLRHRDFFRAEAEQKQRVLSYGFLFDVVGQDGLSVQEMEKLIESRQKTEEVRELVKRYGASLRYLDERMASVRSSRMRAWWFLLWDDLWRRNQNVTPIPSQPASFSPHYRSSICYHPLARADLERFLVDRGLPSAQHAYFNSGFLNRIYLYLDEILFEGTSQAIPIHLAKDHNHLVPFGELRSRFPPPVLGASRLTSNTGAGTDHDDSAIRPRNAFPFEAMYESPRVRLGSPGWLRDVTMRRALRSVMNWLGLTYKVYERQVEEEEEVVFDLRRVRGVGWGLPRAEVDKVKGKK